MSLSNIKVNNSTVTRVDNEPTSESDNLIKSGGVYDAFKQILEETIEYVPIPLTVNSGWIDEYGDIQTSGNYGYIEKEVHTGEKYKFKCYCGSALRAYVVVNASNAVTQKMPSEDWYTYHNYDVEVEITSAENGGKIYISSINGEVIGLEMLETNLQYIKSEAYKNNSIPITALKGYVYNSFDKNSVTWGKYINYSTGEEADSMGYRFSSDYIPVIKGEKYTFPVYSNIYGDNVIYIASYDENKNFLSTLTGTLSDGVLLTITAGNGKYIRVSGEFDTNYYRVPWLLNYNQYMVVNSASYPNRYYPYGKIITFDGELSENMNTMYNPLFGKVVVFDGDSICNAGDIDNNRGWAYRIGIKNNMFWKNYSVGGATITDGRWNSGNNYHIISETQYEPASPDYIIIEGGTNDADHIGSILSGNIPTEFGEFDAAGYTDTFDNDNFCGAVESLFKRLVTTYPNAKIGFIIAQKMSHVNNSTHEIYDDTNEDFTAEHNNRRAYFEYIMKFCKKWGIKYLNLWDECKLNPWLHYEWDSVNSLYVDGQHLKPAGYDVISPIIEQWMKTL